LVSLQTGFMGAAAGLLALPTGLLLAAVLIFVINRRAFGWSLPFQVIPLLLLETLALAIFAALAGWTCIRSGGWPAPGPPTRCGPNKCTDAAMVDWIAAGCADLPR
jgi:hypothetical protein